MKKKFMIAFLSLTLIITSFSLSFADTTNEETLYNSNNNTYEVTIINKEIE